MPAVDCAARTDVDGAESREARALSVNGRGPAGPAEASRARATIPPSAFSAFLHTTFR